MGAPDFQPPGDFAVFVKELARSVPDEALRLRELEQAVATAQKPGAPPSTLRVWTALPLTEMFDPGHLRASAANIRRTGWAIGVALVEFLRNFFVLLPITMTWVGLERASQAYGMCVTTAEPANKLDVIAALSNTPFLLLWQQEFQIKDVSGDVIHRCPPSTDFLWAFDLPFIKSFSGLVGADFVLLGIILALTVVVQWSVSFHSYLRDQRLLRLLPQLQGWLAYFQSELTRLGPARNVDELVERVHLQTKSAIDTFIIDLEKVSATFEKHATAAESRLKKIDEELLPNATAASNAAKEAADAATKAAHAATGAAASVEASARELKAAIESARREAEQVITSMRETAGKVGAILAAVGKVDAAIKEEGHAQEGRAIHLRDQLGGIGRDVEAALGSLGEQVERSMQDWRQGQTESTKELVGRLDEIVRSITAARDQLLDAQKRLREALLQAIGPESEHNAETQRRLDELGRRAADLGRAAEAAVEQLKAHDERISTLIEQMAGVGVPLPDVSLPTPGVLEAFWRLVEALEPGPPIASPAAGRALNGVLIASTALAVIVIIPRLLTP